MAYIVLQRHSITNPSDKFAIVDYDEWTAFAYGSRSMLPVTEYADTSQQAIDRVNELNDNDKED